MLVYNPDVTDPATLPATIAELPTADVGTMAWAPTNASFQSFVTAMRVLDGEDAHRAWLEAMIEAGTETYEGNGGIRDAVANEEVTIGLIKPLLTCTRPARRTRRSPPRTTTSRMATSDR